LEVFEIMDAGEIFATIKEPLSAVDYFLRLLIGVGLFIMIIHITVLILTSGNNYARREEAKEVAAYLIAGG
jgi:hypothetical protein